MTSTWAQRFSNYGCGALALLVAYASREPLFAAYRFVGQHGLHVVLGAGLSFVAFDALYYVLHRLEHRVAWLWRVHAVHHQSAVCDASVSLRTPALAPIEVGLASLVLAWLGVPLSTFIVVAFAHTGLVSLLHSRTPKWLDRAGFVFNTPYLHRGHHGNSAHARSTNFGGVLILWDRLFGTFEPQCEVTTFGLTKGALHPLDANVLPWRSAFTRR